MKTIKELFKTVKTLVLAGAIVLMMVQCSEDEIMTKETIAEDITIEATSASADVASISVAGLYTEIKGDVQCGTCTYVVDPAKTTVDGAELGFKPGNVICLKKSMKYAALEFMNMEGSEANPIVIGYCSE